MNLVHWQEHSRYSTVCVTVVQKRVEWDGAVFVVEELETTVLLRCEVRDTGIGVAPELQSRIFDVFSQADGSTTRKYGGTGLGLALAKHLVEMMQGTIGVESVPGHGSIFWFTARLSPSTSSLPHPSRPSLQGVCVLIVDDNATNRSILQHQISVWGIRSDQAANGPQAMEMLRLAATQGDSYDVAILDMLMPEMDGLALARAIRADLAIAAVHLILLTSVGLEDEASIAQQVGIVCFLSKPARQARLYNCLVAAMQTAGTRPSGEAEPSHAPISEEPHRRRRVLVAEDNVINQVVTGEMLQLLNCQVTVVAHGREALEALTHATYDLVLMDCEMPEMDGFEATKIFREQEHQSGSSHLPIIALTAHVLQGDRERCLAVGMDDYLSKPYTFEQLQLILERWLPGA